MPRTGGVYSLPPGYRAISGEIIRPSQHNPPLEDIAQALTESLPRDGSAPMTGDLAMGGNNVTGMSELRIGTVDPGTDTGPGVWIPAGTVTVQRPSGASGLTALFRGFHGATQVLSLDASGAGYLGVGVRSPETRIITKELLDEEGLVPETRRINTGDGLQGGGNLTANRTLSVNNTVARRNTAQTFQGVQTFQGGVVVPVDGPNVDLVGDGTNRATIRFLNNSTVAGQFWLRAGGSVDYVPAGSNALRYMGNTVLTGAHFSSHFNVTGAASQNPNISLAGNAVPGTVLTNGTVSAAKLETAATPIGVNQQWVNVTGSRSIGTINTNNTGRPIMVSARGNGVTFQVSVNGTTNWIDVGTPVNDSRQQQSFIVPAGHSYRGIGGTLEYWAELR